MRRLIAKLGLGEFNNEGPLTEHKFAPRQSDACRSSSTRARPPLQWSSTATACASGDLIAAPEAGKLGARIHASIDGRVTVGGDAVVIEA